MSPFVRTFPALTFASSLLVSAPMAVAQTHNTNTQLAINIPAGTLADALDVLGDESGMQIIYEPAVAGNIRVAAVAGTFTATEAMQRLLAQTGLRADRVNEKTVVLKRIDSAKGSTRRDPVGATLDGASGTSDDATAAPPQEVVVSAQKRGEERLQETPVPISVLNAESLTDNSQLLLRDYYTSVPGLSVAPNIEAQQMISIRGISTGGGTNPTVGILIDDIPYGSSINWAGNTVPDIDPGDLSRIEVLRGPQGTLYGANSLGGLVKYVTKDPSTERFSSRIEVGTNVVQNGAEPGFSLRASMNAPVSDTLAVRASIFTRQDAGYIDNVLLNIRGINEAEAFGGRLAALWQPTAAFSLKLSALYQNTRGNGVPEVNEEVNGYVVNPNGTPPSPPLGDLQQNYVAGVDRYTIVNQAYAAVMKWRLAGVEITSDTGYNINKATSPFDFSPTFGPIYEQLGYAVSGAPLITRIEFKKISEELRLSGSIWSLDWLVGGFYTHEQEAPGLHQTIYESNATTGQVVGVFYDSTYHPTFKEYAGFADLTWHFTDQFDIQIGGRESHNDQTFKSVTTGPFLQIVDGVTESLQIAASSASGNSFTYLLTPRFKVSPDLMVYARLASGYRPGGPNYVPATNLPASFSPDKTYNYELGLKGDFLDHRLSVDASVYYIDWKNLQLQLQQVYSYDANGSAARSKGVELSLQSRPLTGLSINTWVDYDNAELTAAFPPASTAYGAPGDRLPNTPRFSAELSIQQDFPLFNEATGFIAANADYVGDRLGLFLSCSATCPTPPARERYASYTRTDIRGGAKFDSWTATLYVNNLADVRGITSGGAGYYNPWAFTVIQPRTIGLSVSKMF